MHISLVLCRSLPIELDDVDDIVVDEYKLWSLFFGEKIMKSLKMDSQVKLENDRIKTIEILLKSAMITQKNHSFLHQTSKQPAHSVLLPINPQSHKGHFAHVAVLEGSPNTYGSSRLAALASLRAGASLVTLLTGNFDIRPGDIPEFMKRHVNRLEKDDIQLFDAVIIGPGLGDQKLLLATSKKIVQYAAHYNIPMVIDAGGLSLIKKHAEYFKNKGVIIATPHPGEASYLLDCTIAEIESNRMLAAQKLTELPINNFVRTIFILKGSSPIIIQKGYPPIECEGNVSALSIGGSGDVLCGIIAALIKQSSYPLMATLVAVGTHLQAGRYLESQQLRGSLASDIANVIPKVLYRPSRII